MTRQTVAPFEHISLRPTYFTLGDMVRRMERSQLLVVRLDDEQRPVKAHPTANMEYEGPDGWVRATPVENPASPETAAV
ncbi:hypothetical protein AB0G49_13800 [Streptomyces longwoodensis]|uniref:hypothetical protein n=1 Tax=Streptomyces longwoodensis TaxID=68231 RepID=UPI0033F4716E